MKYGDDEVIECPNCGSVARVFTLASGNTFGARKWTDGKMIAPMLPRPPAITRCKVCQTFFWVFKAKVIGQFDLMNWFVLKNLEETPEEERDEQDKVWIGKIKETMNAISSEWRTAEIVRELNELEYFEAIAGGVATDKEEEKNLRTQAWWAGNDRFRSNEQNSISRLEDSTAAAENLRQLMELLDIEDQEERLMKGEIARELGDFGQSLEILEFDFTERYKQVGTFIKDLSRNEDSQVREIPF